MPAKEETLRNQRVLHIVFAMSSVAMLVSITWMIVQDHFREWKSLQRDFIKFDAAKTEADAEAADRIASQEDLAKLETELEAAREQAAAEVAAAEQSIQDVLGEFQAKEQRLGFLKADRDSIASFYDIELEKGDAQAAESIKHRLDELDRELTSVRQESEDLNDKIDAAKLRIVAANDANKVTELEKAIQSKQKEIERINQKKWTIWSAIRSSPVLDAFAPALKIEQVVLNDLPIHYSFKGVPRFDRCTTCHKGIDAVTKDGAPAYDPQTVDKLSASPYRSAFATHPHPELFASANSPHPRESFGCSTCHLGQGSGTSFVYASHTPNSVQEREQWTEQYDWNEIHHWPWKMNKTRFIGSGCLKCHPNVVDLDTPQTADIESVQKLLQGYNIVRTYGCFGCHEINGWKNGRMIGPDMRLEPQTDAERAKAADPMNPPGRMRKVGPSLRHIAEKVQPDWSYRWIKLPKGFRPDTRMPQFYGLANNGGKLPGSDASDLARSSVELHAVVHYLYSHSEPSEFKEMPAEVKVDPKDSEQVARGQRRFIERGCLACHSHKQVPTAEFPQANQNFGPDLSNVALKLKSQDGSPNARWLFHWIKDPLAYHATSFMPNLQLKDDEAADIAAWLLSVPGEWTEDPGATELDEKMLDELVSMFLQKAMTLKKSAEALNSGIPESEVAQIRGDEKLLSAPISRDKKLSYLGKKTISRLGCFGCHDIPGFETAKPIGTELSAWGVKSRMDPDKLDFAHIVDYLSHHTPDNVKHEPDFELFFEELEHHKGEAFLWQKLREPRSYDYNKLKSWDDKLRMPRFPFADDPKAVEAVMAFVLGLVGDDQIPAHYRNAPLTGPKLAKIEGEKALAKFNCRGCHMTRMPEFTFNVEKAGLPDPANQHASDFPETIADQRALTHRKISGDARTATISAMLVDAQPTELSRAGEIPQDAEIIALDVWEPVEIGNKHFFINDRLNLEPQALTANGFKPAQGGQFAELLVSHIMRTENKKVRQAWGAVPPPLVREGMKVQSAWLYQFLLNPIELRPASRLRMPKFNMTDNEAAQLAAYFAAVDGVDYPYEHIRERDSDYLARKENAHSNYLDDAWSLLLFEPKGDVQSSQKLCAGCHKVSDREPSGGTMDERGPNLVITPDRLRPDWLRQWLAQPSRLVPYTVMPNNFSPATQKMFSDFFQGTSQEQIIGVRDALMNYHRLQQDELLEKLKAQASTGGN